MVNVLSIYFTVQFLMVWFSSHSGFASTTYLSFMSNIATVLLVFLNIVGLVLLFKWVRD